MLAGEVHHLSNFRFRHLICVDPANTDPFLMDMHHDPVRLIVLLIEEALKHKNDEVHRRIIVVEQEHFVKIWPFCFRLGFRNDATAHISVVAVVLFLRHQDVGHGLHCIARACANPFIFASLPHD